MPAQLIPEPWRSLAREWVPRLIAMWSVDGWDSPAGNIRLLGLPDGIHLINGTVCIVLGSAVYSTKNSDAVAYMRGDSIAVGGNRISFHRPIPEVSGIVDGLRITWQEPGVVHGLLARAVGVKILEVRLYARSAVVILDNYPDVLLNW